jgi:PEP-CTERM motif
LFFNFSGSGDFALWQNPNIGSSINWWCVENVSAGCAGQRNSTETVRREGNAYSGQVALRNGNIEIGTSAAVPEPTALALLGLGLFGLGWSQQRKAWQPQIPERSSNTKRPAHGGL